MKSRIDGLVLAVAIARLLQREFAAFRCRNARKSFRRLAFLDTNPWLA
jgi:hypothetical protein